MNRRGFLGSILALGAAPAIVRADSLMRIIPTETSLLFADAWAALPESPSVILVHPTFHEIITKVLREKAPLIRANIEAHNAVLRKLNARSGRC